MPEIWPESIEWDDGNSTDGGRPIVAAVAWNAARRTVRPITAWEQR